MEDLIIDNLKKDEFSNNILENNDNFNECQENQVIEGMIKNDPLFDLIAQHKKKLKEIKEWQNNFTNNNITQTEIATNDTVKLNKIPNFKNNIIISDINENKNIEKNIKTAKDFLKLNSINKSNSLIENTNDDSSVNININKKNANENNSNDNSVSLSKDFDNNINNNIQKYMRTGMNFNNKLELEKIQDTENFNSNNTNNKKNTSSTSRTNNDINNIIKSLEFKLEKKKIEIKKLESNIDILTKENQNLKRYIYDLESKIENYQLNNNTNLINQDNIIIREQEMFKKINSLTKEIQEKNSQIEKFKNLEQQLTEKYHQLELFSKENTSKLENLIMEKNNYKDSIQTTEKIIFTVNYFIKKIYNIIPGLYNGECFQDIKDPFELQKHLIAIENFINEYIVYDSNKKSKFLIDFEKNKNYKEKDELEKKINEINEQNIFLLKEIQGRKKLKKKKSNNSSKSIKITNRSNSKHKK